MTPYAYYNECEPFAAAWLRALIAEGHIANGAVDDRRIEEVASSDLAGFTQCHFFAGIGVWSYALRSAGWDDARPVWTGSCPCQPFSDAGRGGGFDDPRHLWPVWFRLIAECRPDVCFGEQVGSKPGLAWLDLVSADVEGAGYAIGAADLCAAGVGAPHIRQRLYWVAESEGAGRWSNAGAVRGGETPRIRGAEGGEQRRAIVGARGPSDRRAARLLANPASERLREAGSSNAATRATEVLADHGAIRSLDHAAVARRDDSREYDGGGTLLATRPVESGAAGRLGDTESGGLTEFRYAPLTGDRGHADSAILTGHWSDADWLLCRDWKARPVEPGTQPLAHGAPARVGRLRGYGNGLVAPQAAAFIEAYLSLRSAA